MSSREGKGFFQRMNNWVNGKSINADALQYSPSRPAYSRMSYDDYYDDDYPLTNRKGYGGYDHYGSPSGHGGYCYEDQISIGLLITALAGIALMWYTLYTKILASGGRRKRSLSEDSSWFDFNFLSYFDASKFQLQPYQKNSRTPWQLKSKKKN